MPTSKVYFTDMHATDDMNLLDKLEKLIATAGIDAIDFDSKFVAIKMHFGELGNLSFLRPNFARVVVEHVKARGGKPFLTDCNTLYPGSRKNALDHLEAAQLNGFTPQTVGCQVVIADGLRGLDEALVPLTNTKHVHEAKVGRALMDADIVISLTHFKGHEQTGFGGALKNVGMGGGSRAGKMEQHNAGKPTVDPALCRGCRRCGKQCGQDAILYGADHKARIDHERCVGCGRCIAACNYDAIENINGNSVAELCEKMAEYAYAILKDRPTFHISIVNQVSPYCDCHGCNDVPIIPDVGMFASFDPVALDMACADACNAAPVLPGSMLDENLKNGSNRHDHFADTSPDTDWRLTLDHAEKIGLGTKAYELVTL